MNTEQQILQNQIETLKEIGEVKQDIGEIKGTLSRVIPQINNLERNQEKFVSKKSFHIWLTVVPITLIMLISLITKLAGLW